MLKITIPGNPVTKKNSQRIFTRNGKPFVMPSAAYKQYESDAGWHIRCKGLGIDCPVNVKCVYYMATHRRVDLANLLEATCDMLVKYGVLKDDCSEIAASHDGSEVLYDREHPRVEIEITERGTI